MKKHTTKALITSVLSMLLCVSMLIGSTFAWFTDTASTGVNTIVAGNLDVALEVATAWDADGNPTAWEDAEGEKLEFRKAAGAAEDEKILWEPGCTYKLPEIRVVNNGNLWLKYKVVISGIQGNAELNEAIEWTIKLGEEELLEGALEPETSTDPISIQGHMKEEVGNDYKGKEITGISITVQAIQKDAEFDSFSDKYDENADGTPDHPEFAHVNNGSELTEAMGKAEKGDVIVLNSGKYEITESIETDGTFEVAEGADVTLDLGGNSITTEASSSSDEVKTNEPTVLNKGNLTIENGTISNENATAGNTNVAAVHNVSGTLTLKNCVIENVSPTSGGAYAVTVEGGTVVLENCSVTGNRGGIAVSGEGSVKMIGGSVSANVYYPLYIMGTGASTFENVTFIKQNNSKGKAITYNCFKEGEGTATFTGCAFESKTAKAVNLDISKVYTGFTFGNCTFTNVNDPNA